MHSKISIILPTFNGSRFREELLDSLRTQSRPADEVIILDDSSTDKTVSIINEYIKKHGLSSWSLKCNESRAGWKANFWNGMKQASGDLVFPCDQDDIWHKDKVRIMSEIMNANPDINVLRCARKTFSGSSEEYLNLASTDILSYDTHPVREHIYRHSFNTLAFPGCTVCTRKSFVEETDPYWTPEFPYDSYLYRMSVLNDSMYRTSDSVPSLIFQRVHEHNSSIGANKTSSYDYQLQDAVRKEQESSALKDYALAIGKKTAIAIRNHEWSKTRLDLYRTRSLKYWIKLIRYLNYFPGYRVFVFDLKTIMTRKR